MTQPKKTLSATPKISLTALRRARILLDAAIALESGTIDADALSLPADRATARALRKRAAQLVFEAVSHTSSRQPCATGDAVIQAVYLQDRGCLDAALAAAMRASAARGGSGAEAIYSVADRLMGSFLEHTLTMSVRVGWWIEAARAIDAAARGAFDAAKAQFEIRVSPSAIAHIHPSAIDTLLDIAPKSFRASLIHDTDRVSASGTIRRLTLQGVLMRATTASAARIVAAIDEKPGRAAQITGLALGDFHTFLVADLVNGLGVSILDDAGVWGRSHNAWRSFQNHKPLWETYGCLSAQCGPDPLSKMIAPASAHERLRIAQAAGAVASARAAITDPEITEVATPLPNRETLIRAAVHQAWSVRFADLEKAV